jgi:hypothetical protein
MTTAAAVAAAAEHVLSQEESASAGSDLRLSSHHKGMQTAQEDTDLHANHSQYPARGIITGRS